MSRNRLTITLRDKVLKQLDDCIDGSKIRNRSHAIEFILSKYFSPKIKKAVILAGGEGVKMRPFTYEMPKAMIPLNGRPVLEHTIENFRRHDVREILILTGHLGKKIKEYFGDGSRFGVRITYMDQGKDEVGTAAPLVKAKDFVGKQSFFVYYGDVLAALDLGDMVDYHLANDSLITMALTSVRKSSNWGVVRMQGTKINSYLEKPNSRKDLSHLINTGIYIFEPSVFDLFNKSTKRLERDIFPVLVDKGKLGGYMISGQWFDVGDPEVYKKAVTDWRESI